MIRSIQKKLDDVLTSRFDLVRASAEYVVYPVESVGVRSAQYLGAQSTDPAASVSFGRDGYVVESDD